MNVVEADDVANWRSAVTFYVIHEFTQILNSTKLFQKTTDGSSYRYEFKKHRNTIHSPNFTKPPRQT